MTTTARAIPYRLRLFSPWRSAQGERIERAGWTLEITEGDIVGYGECAPIPEAGSEDMGRAAAALASFTADPAMDIDGLPPAARCAAETARMDIEAKRAGRSLGRLLNPDAAPQVRVNAMIGTLDAGAVERACAAVSAGFTVLKIKMGVVKDEAVLLERLSEAVPGAVLRLDANEAWDWPTARRTLSWIEGLPVEAVEDPLAEPTIRDLAALQSSTPIQIAADRTLVRLGPMEVIGAGAIKRVVLKPMILGGPLRAFTLARAAHKAGMTAVVTTSLDAACGAWTAVQLAAAVDGRGIFSHGLDTSRWLIDDTGTPPTPELGRIRVPETPGLGFVPDKTR